MALSEGSQTGEAPYRTAPLPGLQNGQIHGGRAQKSGCQGLGEQGVPADGLA